jgi:small-conductance mechanosensitive channel
MLTAVLNMVPNVVVALLLVAVGIALARWVGQFTAMLLEGTNTARFLAKWGLLKDEKAGAEIPALVGKVTSGIVIMLVMAEAFNVVKLTQMSAILEGLLAYIPNVLVAVAITATGYAVAGFAQRSLRPVLRSARYPMWLGSLAKYALLVLAGTMALEQLGVAESVVVNGFTIVLGSLGLAAAIALGLGSKDTVQSWLDAQGAKRSARAADEKEELSTGA